MTIITQEKIDYNARKFALCKAEGGYGQVSNSFQNGYKKSDNDTWEENIGRLDLGLCVEGEVIRQSRALGLLIGEVPQLFFEEFSLEWKKKQIDARVWSKKHDRSIVVEVKHRLGVMRKGARLSLKESYSKIGMGDEKHWDLFEPKEYIVMVLDGHNMEVLWTHSGTRKYWIKKEGWGNNIGQAWLDCPINYMYPLSILPSALGY